MISTVAIAGREPIGNFQAAVMQRCLAANFIKTKVFGVR